MLEEAVEGFHQLDYRDIRAVIDELVIGVGGIGPAPCISESVKWRLAHLTAGLAKENVVSRVRADRDRQDRRSHPGTRARRAATPNCHEIQPLHRLIINQNSRFTAK